MQFGSPAPLTHVSATCTLPPFHVLSCPHSTSTPQLILAFYPFSRYWIQLYLNPSSLAESRASNHHCYLHVLCDLCLSLAQLRALTTDFTRCFVSSVGISSHSRLFLHSWFSPFPLLPLPSWSWNTLCLRTHPDPLAFIQHHLQTVDIFAL